MKTKTILEKLEYIGSKKFLTIKRWNDDWKHWRAGIEWNSEDDVEFVCERPTLEECLDDIIDFIDGKSIAEIYNKNK
jgi:hypothetical protein